MFGDLAVMYQAGQWLLQGRYESLYPLPTVGLFALLSFLPFPVVVVLVGLLSLALLVKVFRWQTFWWLAYIPVLQVLALSQIDLLAWGLIAQGSPVALALVALKPQLLIFVLPKLISNKKLWRPFLGWLLLLYGPITLLFPTWSLTWLRQFADDDRLAGTGAHLSGLLAVSVVLLLVPFIKGADWRGLLAAVNPALRQYDLSLFVGGPLWLVPLSWLVWRLNWLLQGDNRVWAMIGIAVVVFSSPVWKAVECQLLLARMTVTRNVSLLTRRRWPITTAMLSKLFTSAKTGVG